MKEQSFITAKELAEMLNISTVIRIGQVRIANPLNEASRPSGRRRSGTGISL